MKKRMMLFLLALSLLLGGCEFKDIDKRFFITAIGVDVGAQGDTYKVSLKIAIPKGQLQMGKEDYLTLSASSDSISDAVQKLKTRVDKEFDFGHTRVLVLGQNLMRKDYRNALDWFSRQRYIQRIAWVGIASPSAEDLLSARQESERLPANALILAFGEQGVESQYIVSQSLNQFYRKAHDPGINPVLPVMMPVSNEKGDYYQIDHAAVLGDRRIKMELTSEETKYFNVLTANEEKSDYRVPVGNEYYVIHSDSVSTTRKFVGNDTIRLDVNLIGNVEERDQDIRVTDSKMKQIAAATEKAFADEAKALILKLQKDNADPFGFGTLFRATHWERVEQETRDWQKLYPDVKFDIHVKCEIRASGTIE